MSRIVLRSSEFSIPLCALIAASRVKSCLWLRSWLFSLSETCVPARLGRLRSRFRASCWLFEAASFLSWWNSN